MGKLRGTILLIVRERYIMFVSLSDPWVPKNMCQIHSFPSQIASKTAVGFLILPLNCHAQAMGQFIKPQCWQSIQPMHSGKPLDAFMDKLLRRSSSVGSRRYPGQHFVATASQHAFIDASIVFSPIWRYSSIESAADSGQKIRNAATVCRRSCMMGLFRASVLRTKSPSSQIASYTRWNNWRDMRKSLSKSLLL